MKAKDIRKKEYKESKLPYSFKYKITREFYGEVCPVCGFKMNRYEYTNTRIPSIQHDIPISKGGKHSIDNISVICRSCNCSIRDNIINISNNEKVKIIWNKIKGDKN